MTTLSRRSFNASIAAAVASPALAQGAPAVCKIGWAISKTGPNAGGASTTTLPNYQLWVHTVNEAGGLNVGGRKLKIETVEYDDRSNSEECVRAIERLATQDKVDFILAPWSTGLNLAVGPTFNRYGYPQLGVSSITDRANELVKRWPNAFYLMGGGGMYGEGIIDLLSGLRKEGKIGAKIAMAAIADGFGIDLSNGARGAIKKAGFELAYDKSYPVGTQDLAPIINEVKALNPDVFIAFSYPPDTMTLTDQARIASFNPKIFLTGVGAQFPLFKQRFGANTEGVMGLGGVNANSERFKDYFKRHVDVTKREPDRWGSAVTYMSCQILQQAIEKVGLDRAAVTKELSTGSFDSIIGPVKLQDNQYKQLWLVGQWQNGEYYGIGPADREGAAKPLFPKPAWKAAS